LGVGSSIRQLSIDSWRESEYEAAVKCEAFVKKMKAKNADFENILLSSEDEDDDDPAEAEQYEDPSTPPEIKKLLKNVNAKYLYAGGSARFMFDFSLAKFKTQLDHHMTRVEDWKLYAGGSVSPNNPFAVNSLMQRFERHDDKDLQYCAPISKYVLYHAFHECSEELSKWVEMAAGYTNNPVLAGWAFELNQLSLLNVSLEKKARCGVASRVLNFSPRA
jgi:uncharacterized protein YdcH (DUF465 family)